MAPPTGSTTSCGRRSATATRGPDGSAGVIRLPVGARRIHCGGKDSRGYDAGKKVDGRKRHLVVDTMGLLIVVLVTAASVQDRDGGITALDRAKMAMPSLGPSLSPTGPTAAGAASSPTGCCGSSYRWSRDRIRHTSAWRRPTRG